MTRIGPNNDSNGNPLASLFPQAASLIAAALPRFRSAERAYAGSGWSPLNTC
jgi:hypothetical protein